LLLEQAPHGGGIRCARDAKLQHLLAFGEMAKGFLDTIRLATF
jgi:hypothetical protein